MPFVDQFHRQHPDAEIPGDRCYMVYRELMNMWRESPRWTTIDDMARELFPADDTRAYFLAFLVFFAEHAMPYEHKKKLENGEIF